MRMVPKANNVQPARGARGLRGESQHVRDGWGKGQHHRLGRLARKVRGVPGECDVPEAQE